MLRAVGLKLAFKAGSWLRGLDPVLLAAMIVGLLLRSYAFGAIPRGLNQDEASTAYDAYSLIHFGVDRHGFRLPVVLVSWGSGMYALASYLAAPFIGIFGLEVWSARLPHLLAGMAALPLFFVLVRDTIDLRTARIGVVLLAISPWHIMVSRWGLDSNLFPFVFLVATVLFVRSTRRPRPTWWCRRSSRWRSGTVCGTACGRAAPCCCQRPRSWSWRSRWGCTSR
jgi:hypothetical protein